MYRRFISPWKSDMRNVDYGLFYAVYECRDEKLIPDYLLEPLIKELNWFKRYLPSPDSANFEYRGHNVGICWFRDDAVSMIRRARRMVALMRTGDVWITEARTRNPGRILYKDDYQIIAQPEKKTPIRWG